MEKINSRTPEEIKAGLKACTTGKVLGYGCNIPCPYLNTPNCWLPVKRDALALIDRLESERDAALAKVPKWISVKDELPPRERNILAVNGHGRIKILAFWKKEDKRWTWIEDSRFTHRNDITHWMPLPEPPEVSE